MQDHKTLMTVTGEITDVFAHRFVVKTTQGTILADLGARGAALVSLDKGQTVELKGEKKPSELKVATFTAGGKTTHIMHGKPGDEKGDTTDAPVDIETALAPLRAAGHAFLAEPRRKPKHFEVLARDSEGAILEHHVAFDGHIRKSKPVEANCEKWAAQLAR